MMELQSKVSRIVEKRALFLNKSQGYVVVKRLFDITASFVACIILVPVLIIIAAAIKLDSSGPVFFSQKRNGFKGEVFNMLKFRSMVCNAEQQLKELEGKNEVSGHMFKIRNDPRITRVGRFIRKTSLDELPQLINVIKGDMSIVGPRPPIVRETEKYVTWHNLRLSVKPGLTGLWQISGRSDIGFEEMCRLDLKYIRERGFSYDLKIILKTFPVLLGNSKAF